jgi:hypothetical protein
MYGAAVNDGQRQVTHYTRGVKPGKYAPVNLDANTTYDYVD